MTRTRIGLIFGGAGEEHPISIKSAQQVGSCLDCDRYEPYWIGITTDGSWRLCDGPETGWDTGRYPAAVVSPDRGAHGLLVLGPDRYETLRLDVVMPILHGRYGEDGAMQGLLELSGIPYVGCDVQSSALCMDKSLAYAVLQAAGIPTPTHRTTTADNAIDATELTFPVFVKPARSGSSFGVTKASIPKELAAAVATAKRYDSKIVIEEAVVGREVGCAVLGDEEHGLIVGEVDHIALTHGFFRIHQEDAPEQGSDNSTAIVPADIPEEARIRVQETAKAVYRALGCSGLARVDLFLTDDGTVILNEVNTLPGLTSYSRYPRMMAAAGLPLPEVIDRLVSLATTGTRR